MDDKNYGKTLQTCITSIDPHKQRKHVEYNIQYVK